MVVTDLTSGAQRFVGEAAISGDALEEPIRLALRKGRSGKVEHEGKEWFLTIQMPPAAMVIVGAVHISQALIPMARQVGYEPVIVDPRTAFASPERFPGVTIHAEWPDDALMTRLGVDRYTAFLALTHDPKIDDPALTYALKTGCFFVGALGSRKTHGRRVERLLAAGVPQAQLDRIKAPIGLDIGGISPAEVAVSIIAEVIAAWRQGVA